MTKLLIATLFSVLASNAAHATEKSQILDCMEPVYLDDPNFQQGSEKFFDIFEVDCKAEVKFTGGDLKNEIILSADKNTQYNFDFDGASFYATWNTAQGKVALVLRDFGNRWRGNLIFPGGYQSETLQMAAGSEVDLACVLKTHPELIP
jgi:hypothetical protein